MSEYMFGSGTGWLPRRAARAARRHGAELVNYTDPQCACGRGCAPSHCKASRRHWFACVNLGFPFNQNTEDAVMREVKAAMKGGAK